MDTSTYRREFADYSAALEVAYYEHRAGFTPELRLEPVFDRYGHLFTLEAINDLQSAIAATPAYLETEREGLTVLSGAARIAYIETQARELTDELARCVSQSQIKWDSESLSSFNAPKLIANEPLPARRRDLTARWTDCVAACDDLRAARFQSFHESARLLGFDSYRALFSDITGTDYKRLAAQTDGFLRDTEAAYSSALSRVVARDLPDAAFNELDQADYFFFQRTSHLDHFFPARDVLSTYSNAMRGLGIRVEQQPNIQIDDESRPLKNPRAACFTIKAPDDVRLLLAPIGGVYDYTALFHEAGHAQHFGWASRELAERHPEFVHRPDYATTEGYAFLFNHLFLDPAWLAEHRPGMNERQAHGIASDIALRVAYIVRRLCAKLSYDLELHDDTGADLRSERLAASYAMTQKQATGFSRSPALYLWDVDDGFYAAAYLRALAFEASLREHLRVRHGRRWWAKRKAGDELIDLWNTASRYTVEELSRQIGFGEISFELLAENLIAELQAD
jgi:hypothetical protein